MATYMNINWKAVIAAFIAAGVVNLVGVLFFFNAIVEADPPPGIPIVHTAVGFFVYVILTVALFDWTARQMCNAYKAAFIVAASQFLLVNVDFVLAGKRGLMTGAASTLLLGVTWFCVAFAYSYFMGWGKTDNKQ